MGCYTYFCFMIQILRATKARVIVIHKPRVLKAQIIESKSNLLKGAQDKSIWTNVSQNEL